MDIFGGGGSDLPLSGGTLTGPVTGVDGSTWGSSGITIASGKKLQLTGVTVAGAGSAATAGAGALFYVTDLLAPQLGTTAAGSGAIKGIIRSDGTNWIVIHYDNANTVLFSPRAVHTCGFVTGTPTDKTPVNTECYVAEIFVPGPMSVTGIALGNGSVASGNIKMSLATAAGAPIAATATASTAMAGTSVYQRVPFASGAYNIMGPGVYYVMVQVDNGTARIRSHSTLANGMGTMAQTGQTYGTFTSFTPPTTPSGNAGAVAHLY